MSFKFSEYKNNPHKLIMAKVEKLVKLEKEKPDFERINTPSQLFRELERTSRRVKYLTTSLFRDVISLDLAKTISARTRLTELTIFRMIRFSIPIEIANRLMENYTINTKDGKLFALKEPFRSRLMEHYYTQISEGKNYLEFPKEFYKNQ